MKRALLLGALTLPGCFSFREAPAPGVSPRPFAAPAVVMDAPPAGALHVGELDSQGDLLRSEEACVAGLSERAAAMGADVVVLLLVTTIKGQGPRCGATAYRRAP